MQFKTHGGECKRADCIPEVRARVDSQPPAMSGRGHDQQAIGLGEPSATTLRPFDEAPPRSPRPDRESR